MKMDQLKSKKVIALFSGIIIVSSILIVVAIQLNWFEIGDLGGTIEKNEVSITKAQLNLGNIPSGGSFESTDTAVISIPVTENNGMNVTKFFVIAHASFSDSREYLQERFSSLYLNVTMAGITTTMPIVEANSGLPASDWDYEDSEYSPDRAWWSYDDWIITFLSTGSHNVELKAFGTASAPSVALTIGLSFAFELA